MKIDRHETSRVNAQEIRIEGETKQKARFMEIKSIHRGLKVWSHNLETGVTEEAEIIVTPVYRKGGKAKRVKTVEIQDDCIYETAANLKNAKKKFYKRMTADLQRRLELSKQQKQSKLKTK